jgi:hypothetical protein
MTYDIQRFKTTSTPAPLHICIAASLLLIHHSAQLMLLLVLEYLGL